MPVVNRASGGPGVFSVRDGEPSFVTDSGMRHSIAWESFVSWSARDGQIFSEVLGRFEPGSPRPETAFDLPQILVGRVGLEPTTDGL